jgi:two-component system, chemotaxis family, chemotaxis protein CheY
MVLVVDDDRDIRECLRDLLMEAGYRVQIAAHGRAALELLAAAEEVPAVILLDLMMPVMDGMTFRAHQLGDPRLARIPLVLVTASGRPGGELMAGAQVLNKPLRMKQLLDTVTQSCQSAQAA